MSKLPHDINDDEIRIISSNTSPKPKKRIGFRAGALIAIGAIAVAAILFFIFKPEAEEQQEPFAPDAEEVLAKLNIAPDTVIPVPKPFVAISDTMIDGTKLLVYEPIMAMPRLHVGDDILDDTTVTFVVQAADVRGDNGQIVGACVLQGELVSKGNSKSGYCAIIGGKINIGVAETTPLLEQAIETNGYFFRQYPLVVGNQIVENKPKGKSLRKALGELNGRIVVIMSAAPLSFHDFSQALVDLGVSNAIYLVGSSAYGFAVDKDGKKIEFGKRLAGADADENTNYLVW